MNQQDETCNGKTNWETWAVDLHLNNDERLHLSVLELMQYNIPQWNDICNCYLAKSEWLQDYVADLLERKVIDENISLWRVDWQSILEGFLEIFLHNNADSMDFFDEELEEQEEKTESFVAWKSVYEMIIAKPDNHWIQ